MKSCQNCGRVAPANARICQNCGVAAAGCVWPPSPSCGWRRPRKTLPGFLTGSQSGDILCAVLVSLALSFAFGLGLLIGPFLYLAALSRYPAFARALGWTYIVITAVVAVAFSIWIGMSTGP